jgi:GntR family transcriptional repressor for pyruvate dehydrogenase complex
MRTHEQVLVWMEAQLDGGALTVGDRLPGERTLAERLGVSRTSAREAIRVLEAMGIVRSGVGSGPAAGTFITADPASAMGAALRMHVAAANLPVSDIVRTRVLLETWAAANADPAHPALERAADLVEAMAQPSVDVEEFLRLDTQFHVAIAESAGNILVGAMMSSLRESIERYANRLTDSLPDWAATSARLLAEHRQVLAAVRDGRADEAAGIIGRHIEGYYAEAGMEAGCARRQ